MVAQVAQTVDRLLLHRRVRALVQKKYNLPRGLAQHDGASTGAAPQAQTAGPDRWVILFWHLHT